MLKKPKASDPKNYFLTGLYYAKHYEDFGKDLESAIKNF